MRHCNKCTKRRREARSSDATCTSTFFRFAFLEQGREKATSSTGGDEQIESGFAARSAMNQLLFPIERVDVLSPVSGGSDGEWFSTERKGTSNDGGAASISGRINLICIVDLEHHQKILFEEKFT